MAKLKKPPGTSVDYYSIVFLTSKLLRFMTLETNYDHKGFIILATSVSQK